MINSSSSTNSNIIHQQTLFSFFYPQLKRRRLKNILNITKEYNLKRFTLYKKIVTSYDLKTSKLQKKKINKLLFKNFFFEKFKHNFSKPKNIVYIKINPNNTMITWTDKQGNVIYKVSAGMLGLHSSKKNYKLINNLVISEFFKKLKSEKKNKFILFKLSAPKILRRRILRRLKFFLRNKNFFENLRTLSFNGCRPSKVRRKKRKGLRLYKPKI